MIRYSDGTRQRGVALLTALLIVALATIIATSAMWDFNLDQRRTAAMLYHDQASMYALGAEAWAGRILIEDAEDSQNDHPGEAWATNLPALPIEGGSVDGAIIDLQGRFNINNLVGDAGQTDEAMVQQLETILEILDLDKNWAGLAADWIDSDIEPNFPSGAEDSVYMGVTPPRRTPNTSVTSITELMSLPDMNNETFEILRPHITALPRGTPINVNTATTVILQSLLEDRSESGANNIIADRPEDGYESVSELSDSLSSELATNLSVSSNFFRTVVRVNVGTVDLTLYSLLERENTGSVRTLLRSFGTE
jgi:general secretion pathway protein K